MKKLVTSILLMFILCISLVMGASTLEIRSLTYVSDEINVNATFVATTEFENCTVLNFTISDGITTLLMNVNDTGAEGMGLIYGFNDTEWWGNGSDATIQYDTGNLTDDSGIDGWTITGNCYNFSGSLLASDTELVTADNTIPVCTQATLSNGLIVDVSDVDTYVVSITGTNGTSGTLNLGGNTYILSESSDVFSYDIINVPKQSYTVDAQISDGYNSTSCTQINSIQVKKQVSGASVTVGGDTGVVVVNGQAVQGTSWLKSLIDWFKSLFK